MYKIAVENLPALFRKIAADQELYLPVKVSEQVNFKAWSEDAEVSLETLKTVKSPKDAFFPQSENLYTCKKDGKNISIEPQALKDQNFVVFGMRACDVQGVKVLDNVFLGDPVDTFYQARREHGTIVALACHEPEESCFCKVFGIDAADPEADVAAWIIEGELFWKPLTEKGNALTEAVKELLADADETKVEEEKKAIRGIIELLPYTHLSLEGWAQEEYMDRFNSPVWEKLYKPCLACGTCTFVCPTCQCYDIKDYDTGHGVQRYRCWDSCMYSDFTMMAHGNNRTSQMQRFRQRFMHKLVYYPANNNGMYSCVGCGRCVEKCPASLNIVKEIKAFDFMKMDDVAIYNAIATAEGAIMEAIKMQPINLHKSRCLVLGYGRCAKVLAAKLKGMDAQVTVCARNKTARSLAKSFGLEVMDFTELKRRICQYDHIFNTVPKQILKEDILRKISKESCIIDIASYPGGTNHQMAEKLGICAKLCPSLPGIYSPKSSGIMLAKKVLEISGEIKHGIEK